MGSNDKQINTSKMNEKEIIEMLLWVSKSFHLCEGIWYWPEDEDGDNPLTEADLLRLWIEQKQTK